MRSSQANSTSTRTRKGGWILTVNGILISSSSDSQVLVRDGCLTFYILLFALTKAHQWLLNGKVPNNWYLLHI